MVKFLAFLLFVPSVLSAGQVTAQYKRNLMFFCYDEFGSTFTDKSTHTWATNLVGSGQAVISGKDGLALSLNGNGGFQLPDATLRSPDTNLMDFTLMFSVRPTGGATASSCLFCHNGAAAGTHVAGFKEHRLYWDFGPEGCSFDTVEIITSALPVSSQTSHQVVYTRLNSERKEIWLDGIMVASAATKNCVDAANTVMEIGGNVGGANNNVIADISEAVGWKTYFTAGEIGMLYQQWKGKPKQFLNTSVPQ